MAQALLLSETPEVELRAPLPARVWGSLCVLLRRLATHQWFAEHYPIRCDEADWVVDTDENSLREELAIELEFLDWPPHSKTPPSARVALELVQFCWRAVSKPATRSYHDYGGHYHLEFDRNTGRQEFAEDVNRILVREQVPFRIYGDGFIRVEREADSPVLAWPAQTSQASSSQRVVAEVGPTYEGARGSRSGTSLPSATVGPGTSAGNIDPIVELDLDAPELLSRPARGTFMQNFDVCVICALPEELDKLRDAIGSSVAALESVRWEAHVYKTATLKSKGGTTISVVMSCPTFPGLSASAVLATKMILRFRPRLVALVGIAAGTKAKNRGFGDILFADKTIDYGTGKWIRQGGRAVFKPSTNPLDVESVLVNRIKQRDNSRDLAEIESAWPAERPLTKLGVHVGPFASGDVVVDDRKTVDRVLEGWRKLIAIEMEAYAVHRACADAVRPAPVFVCVKSVSDFAEKKNDRFRDYAAYTAARYFVRFLLSEWDDLHLSPPDPQNGRRP